MIVADSLTNVLVYSVPGLTTAIVVYLRSLSKRLDAETRMINETLVTTKGRLDSLENGGGERKVKDVMAKTQVLTANGVFGRRSETINAEVFPVDGIAEHSIQVAQNLKRGIQ